MKKFSLFILFGSLAVAGPARSEEAANALPELLRQARERNPEIKSAFQKWKVVDKESGAASVWPNPTISYIDEKDPTGVEGMEPMKRKHYGIEQEIPFPGKLSSEARMKRHEARIAEADYRNVVLDVESRIKILAARMGTTDRQIALARENVASMRRALSATQSRIAANKGMTSDFFMAQMELRRMENMVFEKTQERKALVIELNALLDLPIDHPWTAPFPQPEWREFDRDLAGVAQIAENNSPLIQSAQHEINHSHAMRTRSRFEYAPDFGIMYEYQTAGEGPGGTGPAGRQLGLSLSVPLWLKRPMRLAAGAEAHRLEAEAEAINMINMVKKMVAMECNEVITHVTLARKIQNEILPAANGALKITHRQYAAGRGDFLRLLEANRAWTSMQMEYQDEIYHVAEHWALLEKWVGTSLETNKEEKKQ